MPTIAEEFKYFIESAPEYRDTWIIDDIRSREFTRLEESVQVYLDHTGAALYSRAQLRHFVHSLSHSTIAAPNNGFSDQQSKRIEHCRRRFLRFFGADPEEYSLIFTSTVSHAMHMVACGYPFTPHSRLLLTIDNHQCTDYLAQQAKFHGSSVSYAAMRPQTLQLDEKQLLDQLNGDPGNADHRLLVFPAQSNLSGVRHPLSLVNTAQQLGWEVLLDATSFAPTAPLNMSRYHPDFLTLSFYKLFGFPSGLGALIVKKSVESQMYRPQNEDGQHPAAYQDISPCAPPEVLDFLGIPSLEYGLDVLEEVSYNAIEGRTQSLVAWLARKMKNLRHKNRQPAMEMYGAPQNDVPHGPVIAFNFLDNEGHIRPVEQVKPQFEAAHIILGQGDFENPGLCSLALGANHSDSDMPQQMWRVSLGLSSNFPDVFTFWETCKQISAK